MHRGRKYEQKSSIHASVCGCLCAGDCGVCRRLGDHHCEPRLKKFLADPTIKPAEMPNLNLNADEIEALAAFINKSTVKSIPADSRRNP